jgi:hypothetical protein
LDLARVARARLRNSRVSGADVKAAAGFLFATLVASAARAQEAEEGPPQQEEQRPHWNAQRHVTPMLRTWAGATVAHLSGEQITYAGGTVAVGYESLFSVRPTLNEWFYGSVFGAEARARVLRSVDSEGSWLVGTGLAFTSYVLPKDVSRHLRFAGFFSIVIPEVGVAFRHPEPHSLSLRWSAPIAYLVHPHIAVELVPAMTFLTHTPRGEIELLWELTLGVSWRQIGQLPIGI